MTELPIVRWSRVLFDELTRGPATLRRARFVLINLPGQLETLTATLDRTNDTIERSLVDLSTSVGELRDTVAGLNAGIDRSLEGLSSTVGGVMHERIEHLDEVVSELGTVLTSLIGAIPGARRALRSTSNGERASR